MRIVWGRDDRKKSPNLAVSSYCHVNCTFSVPSSFVCGHRNPELQSAVALSGSLVYGIQNRLTIGQASKFKPSPPTQADQNNEHSGFSVSSPAIVEFNQQSDRRPFQTHITLLLLLLSSAGRGLWSGVGWKGISAQCIFNPLTKDDSESLPSAFPLRRGMTLNGCWLVWSDSCRQLKSFVYYSCI